MTRNQAILAELIKAIDEIRKKLRREDHDYNHALNQLRECITESLKITHRSSYFEKNSVVKGIMKIIHHIDHEIESIEIEMHGVANYSSYEGSRITEMTLIQSIRSDLNAMLHLIIQARPEVRDTELSSIINMIA